MTDLKKKRGDSIRLAVGPVLKPDGTIQNLTGLVLRFTAKDRLSDSDGAAILTGSTADGRISITDAAGGMALVVIPGSLTAAFPDDRVLHWDVQLADPGGTITETLDSGRLFIERDVTRTSP